MKYSTYNNPLHEWWRGMIRRSKAKGTYIYPLWTTWRGFAKWAEAQGYDENTRLYATSNNPFTPEYLGTTRSLDRDCEYIAYDSQDPYELPITSASYIEELSEKLIRMGYHYTTDSIMSALTRNETIKPSERVHGLIFEKIDLSNYNEDDEPFEIKEN